MSTEEPLPWPRSELGALASAAPVAAGPSKNRSPVRDVDPDRREAAAEIRVARPTAPPRVVREYVPQPAAWTTRVVRDDAGFKALQNAWAELHAESDGASVFTSHEWMHSWWSAYRPAAELAIVVAEDRQRVRGIAPLMVETRRKAGVTVRTLRFIGDGTGESDHVDFVTAAVDRSDALRALLAAVERLDWDVAEFNQLPEHSPTTREVLGWLERRRLPFEVESSPCPVRTLPKNFDELLASLPSRLRTSIRSSRRKLGEGRALDFGLHTRPEELDAALRTFFENHESRWQGKGISGAFSNPRRRDFYARLTPRLLERGWLRFFYLKLDGRPIAQQYCFAVDGTVMLLQEGFDFAHAQNNVGNVLRSLVFEHLIGAGAACYDFLAGTSRHKQSWSDSTVNDLRVRCARRSLKGRLFFNAPRWIKRAKDTLRPWRDRLVARTSRPTP